ncbi:zinc finger protein 277 [Lepeophtheirus salmonis]|uniref:Zinc finger protein 277 [Gallus gallus] n=1 Tax=Lepeophtheirus salmonis TaxID=72036 RepID=A0A0K2U7W2_LEPSM|nr:zinc finger protein 277-like [Lepeophtheirus salmonis]
MAVTSHAKLWSKQYFDDSNFPEWTKSNIGITVPLMFPEQKISPFGVDKKSACIFCEEVWLLPKDQQSFFRHLLEVHSFVVGDVNLIADIPAYVGYWKGKFCTPNGLKDHAFQMKAPVTGPDGKTKIQKNFFFLNDTNPEDRELRVQLQMKRLEQVLEIREKERRNTDFNRGCLFCRLSFSEDPKNLFDHMTLDHNFSVGQTDNLVFFEELLDILEKKLIDMTCIYCEKVFKSREVLKEHMRKKSHKKINPKNSAYDKYYLVNYLEFGKTWSENSKRDIYDPLDDDELPTGFESDNENENDWSDWKGDLSGAVCLFCDASYDEVKELVNHMSLVHEFDFESVRKDSKLSFYQQVKCINFIRRQIHLKTCINCLDKFQSREELMLHMEENGHFKLPDDKDEWDQSQYFFPTYENDNFLSCLEENEESTEGNGEIPPVIGEDCPVKESILSEEDFRESLLPKSRRKKQEA